MTLLRCKFETFEFTIDLSQFLLVYQKTFVYSDLGAHIDGFIAVVAHTIIVGASPDKKITGRKADAFLAAYQASQAALRLLKPKTDVSFCIRKVFALILVLL